MKQFVRQRCQERLTALDVAIRALRKSPEDVEALHGVRVSTRRLQQCLRLFHGFFAANSGKKLRRRLHRLMDRCGPVRDWDIAGDVLKSARLLTPELRARIQDERAAARKRLIRQLERWRGDRSARAWKGLLRIRASDWAPPDSVREWFDAGDRAVDGGPADLHRFRLLGKRLRYSIELLDADSPYLTTLKRVQDTLGDISDCATTQALMPELAAQLHPQLDRRTAKFRTLWATVRKQKDRWNSIFSATAKPKLGKQAAMTKPAR